MSPLFKTILLVLEECFYFFFPLSEDEKAIRGISRHQFEKKLSVRTHNDCVVLTTFSDPEVRAVMHLVKFHRNQHAIDLASHLLSAWLVVYAKEPAILIPIPLSKKRERERGFNQVTVVLSHATKGLQFCNVRTNILARIKHTRPQTSLSRAERLTNTRDIFTTTNLIDLSGQNVIIIDDVTTTGATLHAAKNALSKLNPKSITLLAIAH